MATMTGPRRAVVEEDWPAAGKRRRAGAVQLQITRGDHVVVVEKISPALYLAVANGVAGTIRKKHFAFLKKSEAPEFVLPPLDVLEAAAAPVREHLKTHAHGDDDGAGEAADNAATAEPSPAAPAPVSEPAVAMAVVPISEPAPPPVAEPAVAATSEPAVAPVSEPAVAPVSEPVPVPAPVPAPEPAAATASERAAVPVSEPAPAIVSEPAPAPASSVGAGIGDTETEPTPAAGSTIIKRTDLDDDQVDTYGFEHDPTVEQDLGTAPTPKDVERQRKWLTMLNKSWAVPHPDSADFVRRSWKGIPRSVRWQAWSVMVGAHALRQAKLQVPPGHDGTEPFRKYLVREHAEIDDVIDRDIDRCLPSHQRFRVVHGEAQQSLEDVLKAYAGYNPELGYCQGMGMIVSILLLHMPPDDAFWILTALLDSDKYLKEFYNKRLTGVIEMANIFKHLLHVRFPKVAKHLDDNGVDVMMYCTPWFMTLFATTLPWTTVMRIWDAFFCQGKVVLMQYALAIIETCKDDLLNKCPTLQEILELLLKIPIDKLLPSHLVPIAQRVKISKADMQPMQEAKA